MRKADSLRRWLTAFLPDLRKEADRLQVYLEGGRISARRSATLSFAYAYTVKALITDFSGNPDTVMVATCFLYPAGGSGPPRRVIMKSFTWGTGRSMTGFDIEAGGIRTFEFAKVVQWLPVPPEYRNRTSTRLRRRGSLRRKAMFRKLASARYLKAQADDQGFWVGFSGKVSQIASIHQNGLRDKPSLRARAIEYPRRELLGTTPTDREHMLDLLYEQLAYAIDA